MCDTALTLLPVRHSQIGIINGPQLDAAFIDDQLPYDPQKGTLMCMSTLPSVPSPSTLWPSLLEKAVSVSEFEALPTAHYGLSST